MTDIIVDNSREINSLKNVEDYTNWKGITCFNLNSGIHNITTSDNSKKGYKETSLNMKG